MIKNRKLCYKIGIVSAVLVGILLCVFLIFCMSGKKNLSENIVAYASKEKTVIYNNKEYGYRDGLINILCLGIDKEEQMALRNDVGNSVGQADAIFLASFDTKKKVVQILAIPRDTMVSLQMYDASGAYMGSGMGQLTLQYAYGDGMAKSANLMVNQVANLLYGIPINAYAAVNVHSLWVLNAAVGGVDMYMDEDYTMLNPAFVKGTTVHLTGNLLENYIRERDSTLSGTAYTRMYRLKRYMFAYYEKAKEVLKQDITLPFRLLDELQADMETTLTMKEITYLLTEVFGCSLTDESFYILPGEQVMGEEYEEFYIDENEAMELLIELFYEEVN